MSTRTVVLLIAVVALVLTAGVVAYVIALGNGMPGYLPVPS